MTTQKILTIKLNNGRTVLAKETKFGINAVNYVSNKQANNKVEQLQQIGIDCWFSEFDRIKFVYVNLGQ